MDNLELEKYRWDAENCCGCKCCIWVDPIYVQEKRYSIRCPSLQRYQFDAFSAFGRLKLAMALLEGKLGLTKTALDIVYKCNLCGACDAGCKRNLDLEPLAVLEAMRANAVKEGLGPPPALCKVAENILETGNRYGLPPQDRTAWLAEESILQEQVPMALFMGCNLSYKNTALARTLISVLDHLNIEYRALPEESCCGHPLMVAGMVLQARETAEKNIARVEANGITTLVTACAECYKTWKVDYPKLLDTTTGQLGYRVLHVVELLAYNLPAHCNRFSHPINMAVAYHDPCALGRLSEPWEPWHGTRGKYGITSPPKRYRRGTNGIYQAPRELLCAIPGIELVELPRRKENALCCGAGGGVAQAYPDFALFTAKSRIDEAIGSGAQALVSACPYCLDMLRSAANDCKAPIKVYDILEMIKASVTGEELSA